MTPNDLNRLAVIASGDDVDPLDATRLDTRSWGWNAPDAPPPASNPAGWLLLWCLAGLGLWVVLIVGLWAMWSGAWRIWRAW